MNHPKIDIKFPHFHGIINLLMWLIEEHKERKSEKRKCERKVNIFPFSRFAHLPSLHKLNLNLLKMEINIEPWIWLKLWFLVCWTFRYKFNLILSGSWPELKLFAFLTRLMILNPFSLNICINIVLQSCWKWGIWSGWIL